MSGQSQLQFVLSNGRELVLVDPEAGRALTMGGHFVTHVCEQITLGGARLVDVRIQSNGPVRSDPIIRQQLQRIMASLFRADQLTIEELLALVHRKMEERK